MDPMKIAERDQMTAGMAEIADILANLRRNLRNAGFSRHEAAALVREYFSPLVWTIAANRPAPDAE